MHVSRFTLALFTIVTLPLAAQSVPATLNYQGRLTDNSPQQNPLTATAAMSFELWDCAACSTPAPDRLWVEPATGTIPVTVSGGIFNVMLGGNGVPLPASVFSGGTQRWLQIIVNGEALTPRQQIGAAGYASQAENAATANAAITASSATTALTAQSAVDSQQLGGVSAGGYQLATSAACGANQFVNSITATGATGCATPQTVIPLPLELSGSDPGPLVHVTQNGAGQGLRVDVATADASAVVGFNAGLGKGGNFQVTNPANGNYALYAATNGTGAGGVFQVTNPADGYMSLYADTAGAGYAGVFRIFNPASGNNAMYVDTNGTGNGLFAYSPGHNAVYGQSGSPGNSGVFGENIAGGYGVAGSTQSDNADGVLGDNFGAGPAVHGLALGTGPAGKFEIVNTASPASALTATTAGSGSAAAFSLNDVSNNSPMISGFNYGGGPAVEVQTVNAGEGVLSLVLAGSGTAIRGVTGGTGAGGHFSHFGAGAGDALYARTFGTGTAAHFVSNNTAAIPLVVEAGDPAQAVPLQAWKIAGSAVAYVDASGVFIGNGAGLTNLSPFNLSGGIANISISGNADTVTNGVYTTGSYSDPAWITTLAGVKVAGSVALAASAANATTVTNGVYTTGSYSNPAWITGLAGAKITGSVASAGNATTVTNGVYTTGSYSDPVWISALAGGKITGSVAQATNSANATNATTVTNGLYSTGSYADPAWLTSLAGSKITGAVAQAAAATTATNSTQLGGVAAAGYQLATTQSCGAGQFLNSIANGSAACAGAQSSLVAPLLLSGNISGPVISAANSGSGAGAYGENSSGTAVAFAVHGKISNASASGNSAGLRGEHLGASGYGVWGSQSGSGWGVYGLSGAGTGVYGASLAVSGLSYGVYGTTASNTSQAAGVYGIDTAAGGTTAGLYGVATASPGGTGVVGKGQATGGFFEATAAAAGSGLIGQSDATSGGAYGVTGTTASPAGAGVRAVGAGTGSPALRIENGGIQVPGAGTGTATPVFVHSATAGNITGNRTQITNPLTDGDPSALLIVTHNFNPGGVSTTTLNKPFGVYYIGGHWAIYLEDITAMPVGAAFNVLVIKP